MLDLITEALALQKYFEAEEKDFFFVGGMALQVWGQPRLTTDIDCTIFTNLIDEDEQILELLKHFKSRFKKDSDALEHARARRVLLVQSDNGTGIDILLSGLADINEELRRSSYQQFTDDISLRVCSAESLIAFKTVAGRFQDYADIESVLTKQKVLDWDYIDAWLASAAEYQDIAVNLSTIRQIKEKNYGL